jgi:hypothetical protein
MMMDKEEALTILRMSLEPYRGKPYDTLVNMIDAEPVTMEETGRSGQWYQLEIEAVWDAGRGGPVRLIGAIDDGGWRAFFPLTDDFIKTPSGEFLDED